VTLRRNYGVRACAVAGVILAGLAAAGCAQPARPRQASVAACTEFGVSAIERHVTVTSVPAACAGLTRAQVNFAVSSALHAMAVGAHGKVRQRERAVNEYRQAVQTNDNTQGALDEARRYMQKPFEPQPGN